MVQFGSTALTPIVSFGDVTLANGVRLHYRAQGPRLGAAIILLHGYADSSLSFSRVMPLIPTELRVIAPDLRGHGASDRPGGYRIVDMAFDVIELMDALKVPTAVIVGHSMGSFVAQAIADRAPTRITSLVLMGSAPDADNTAMRELQSTVNTLADPVDLGFVREFQHSTVNVPVPEAFMDAAIANSLTMPAAVWKQVIKGLIDFRPATVRPAVRTLVLGGKQDSVFSTTEHTQLARQFGDGRLQLIDDVGHALHWEMPVVFVDAVLRFAKMK